MKKVFLRLDIKTKRPMILFVDGGSSADGITRQIKVYQSPEGYVERDFFEVLKATRAATQGECGELVFELEERNSKVVVLPSEDLSHPNSEEQLVFTKDAFTVQVGKVLEKIESVLGHDALTKVDVYEIGICRKAQWFSGEIYELQHGFYLKNCGGEIRLFNRRVELDPVQLAYLLITPTFSGWIAKRVVWDTSFSLMPKRLQFPITFLAIAAKYIVDVEKRGIA